MSDLREIEFTILYNGKPTKFSMVEMLGEEDEALIVKHSKPDGSVDMAELWVKRLVRCIKEPPLNDTTIKQATRRQLSLLKAKWLELNEATKDDFLESPKASPPGPATSP